MDDMQNLCKLCGGTTEFRFAKVVLFAHRADYFECRQCGCLQVPEAPWLDEAYATECWPIDTGLVARNLQLAGSLAVFLQTVCARDEVIVDFGGGTGLLTRLLRDLGWDVRCHDRYRRPLFVDAFHVAEIADLRPAVVVASEVFEHFATPRESLAELFAMAPIIVFTTELYRRQGADWWYLVPETGQHIFFFSPVALEHAAKRAGFTFADAGVQKFFVRDDLIADDVRRARIEAAIGNSRRIDHVEQAMLAYLRDPYRHVAADYEAELKLHRRRGAGRGHPLQASTNQPSPSPSMAESPESHGRRETFAEVYRTGAWGVSGDDGFCSGWGAEPRFSDAIVELLAELASGSRTGRISVVDVGCGDFRTGSHLLGCLDCIESYEALDIVPALVERNRAKFEPRWPQLRFSRVDAVVGPIPAGDVVLIRQVLQHLSNADAARALRNVTQAARLMAVIVEHVQPMRAGEWNLDKPSDKDVRLGKGLNLRKPPFDVPVAREFDVPLTERDYLRISCIPNMATVPVATDTAG